MHPLANRLYPAIRLLAGSGSVKQRLARVWLKHLDDLEVTELPASIQAEFLTLRRAMYARDPQPKEAAPTASIRKMSIKEATEHAEKIIQIFRVLSKDSDSESDDQVLEFRVDRSRYPQPLNTANDAADEPTLN